MSKEERRKRAFALKSSEERRTHGRERLAVLLFIEQFLLRCQFIQLLVFRLLWPCRQWHLVPCPTIRSCLQDMFPRCRNIAVKRRQKKENTHELTGQCITKERERTREKRSCSLRYMHKLKCVQTKSYILLLVVANSGNTTTTTELRRWFTPVSETTKW